MWHGILIHTPHERYTPTFSHFLFHSFRWAYHHLTFMCMSCWKITSSYSDSSSHFTTLRCILQLLFRISIIFFPSALLLVAFFLSSLLLWWKWKMKWMDDMVHSDMPLWSAILVPCTNNSVCNALYAEERMHRYYYYNNRETQKEEYILYVSMHIY